MGIYPDIYLRACPSVSPVLGGFFIIMSVKCLCKLLRISEVNTILHHRDCVYHGLQVTGKETKALVDKILCLHYTMKIKWGHSDAKFSILSFILLFSFSCCKHESIPEGYCLAVFQFKLCFPVSLFFCLLCLSIVHASCP